MRQRARVLGRLHNNFVRANGRHSVVDSLGASPRVAFDTVERPQMRMGAHLPGPLLRQIEEHVRLDTILRAQWTRVCPPLIALGMPDYEPASCDGIFTKFHSSRRKVFLIRNLRRHLITRTQEGPN